MKFYNQQHQYYCGIDLHARKMYVCIHNQKGKTVVHENINTDPEMLFELIFPYLDDVGGGGECVFCWYRASPSPRQAGYPTFVPRIRFLLSCIIHESHPRRQNKK